MKRILLISDTHGYLDPALIKYIESADEVWHAGDIGTLEISDKISALKPFRAVYGNIDGKDIRATYPEDLAFSCEGVKVLMTHIAGPAGKYLPRVQKLLEAERPELFICGHSHILKVQFMKQYAHVYMNPGACGVQGFHAVKTVVRFVLNAGSIENAEVIELGKRASI
jgi:uncharacterized protein